MRMPDRKVWIEIDGQLPLPDGLVILTLEDIDQSQRSVHRGAFVIEAQGLLHKLIGLPPGINRGGTPSIIGIQSVGGAQPHISQHVAGVKLYGSLKKLARLDVILLIESIQKVVSFDSIAPGFEILRCFCIHARLLAMG